MAVASPSPHPRAADGPTTVRRLPERSRRVSALVVALGVLVLYAAFGDGATELPQAAWLEVGVAAVGIAACAAWASGALRLRAAPWGWAGLALLVAFVVWTAAGIAWSVAPDRAWAELNRALAYAVTVVLGIAIGASDRRAPERVGRMLAVVAVPVALYALGGKTLPGLHVGGVLDLDHAGASHRLRAPLGYSNALALFCVIGLLPMLRLAADPWRRPWPRVATLLGVYLFVLVIGLTSSRGGFLALAAGVGVLVALTTERVRTLALAASAAGAAVLPLGVALSRADLTTDRLPLARREDDALVVLATVLVGAVLLAAWGRAVVALEDRRPVAGVQRVGRRVTVVLAALVAVLALAWVAAGRADRAFQDFKHPGAPARQTDPDRVVAANPDDRWAWWSEAVGGWSDKPLAGWGPGSFAVVHRLYRTEPVSVEQAHSAPLQWLAETGLVGFLLAGGGVLALLAAALSRVRGIPWAPRGAPPERGWAAALAGVAVAWAVQACYDWDWEIPAVTVPAMLALGVLAARPEPVPDLAAAGRGRSLVLAGAALLLALVMVSAILPELARTRTASALERVGGDQVSDALLADAATSAELASRLDPLAVEPLFALAAVAERRGRTDLARDALLRAARRQPEDVGVWVRLARLDATRRDRAAVRREAQEALERDPANPAVIALARRALAGSAPPGESPTATGTPLVVPAPSPAAPAPTPAAGGFSGLPPAPTGPAPPVSP